MLGEGKWHRGSCSCVKQPHHWLVHQHQSKELQVGRLSDCDNSSSSTTTTTSNATTAAVATALTTTHPEIFCAHAAHAAMSSELSNEMPQAPSFSCRRSGSRTSPECASTKQARLRASSAATE